MRPRGIVLALSALLLGCESFRFPSAEIAQPVPEAPAVVTRAMSSNLQIIPMQAQPGFQVCASCGALAPTPKTLATVAAPSPLLRQAGVTRQVAVRYATSIPFAFNSARIAAAGITELDAFVGRLPVGARVSLVSVSGRTDSIGPQAANARIARARAQAVLAVLRARLHPQTEDIRSEPLCCYIASNATAAGRADNRRVDVVAIVALE